MFQMPCNKCKKLQPPYLDPKSEEVYCSLCDEKIENITHFAKMQLKTLKQYREKKKTSFAVKCKKCNKEERPKLVKEDIVCGACKEKLDHLSPFFKQMLKLQLSNADKEI